MAIKDITNPEWVRMAMAQYRELGEVNFLNHYGFKASTRFDVLDDEGRRYAPKAILGVAHGFRNSRSKPLTSKQMMGGKPTNTPLRKLGFTVVEKETSEQTLVPSTVGDADEFNPKNITDARQRVVREIIKRRGQTSFRNELIIAYNGRCAISGCSILDVLEAAHIFPYLGAETNHVTNGILLRSDLHTLFDLKLIAIHPTSLKLFVDPGLEQSEYRIFAGKRISLPHDANMRPSIKALESHWKEISDD